MPANDLHIVIHMMKVLVRMHACVRTWLRIGGLAFIQTIKIWENDEIPRQNSRYNFTESMTAIPVICFPIQLA